jgi:hypothetical protein
MRLYHSVACVKQQIREKDRIPVSDQRLLFSGRQLDDKFTLADYNISSGCQLDLSLRLSGGAGKFAKSATKFVDVSNESGMERRGFVESAPMWRKADVGLNLEGKCNNVECDAYGCLVIMPMGAGVFDLIMDSTSKSTGCPCCGEFVRPRLAGFSRCEYKWIGLKGQCTQKAARREQS